MIFAGIRSAKRALVPFLLLLIFALPQDAGSQSKDGDQEADKQEVAQQDVVRQGAPFTKEDRIQYIFESLQAILSAKKNAVDNTYQFLRVLRNYNCISAVRQLEVQCLIESAKRNCQGFRRASAKQCQLYSDVMIATMLEEPRIVTRSLKAKIARESKNAIGPAVQREIERHFSVVTLSLLASKHWNCKSDDWSCIAKAIHGFCDSYTVDRSGSWQGCASGIIFYIGASKG